MFNLRTGWSPESVVPKHEHTHTRLRRMLMNPVQKSLSKHFGAWLFETLSTTVTAIVLRSMT